jgi:GxxExxY protein
MPIVVHAELRRPTQDEFATIAYDVMHHLFAIHNEFGRFLREEIYKQELAVRRHGVQLEVVIDVSFDRFSKRYAMDVVADHSAVFELKTVETLNAKHRAQLLNYLLLAELPHGKLVNMRPDVVEHEFVNTTLRLADRRQFSVVDDGSIEADSELRRIKDLFLAVVNDWGSGLELPLYTEAVTELSGGAQQVIQEVEIVSGTRVVGTQKVHLATADTVFKITSVDEPGRDRFAEHAQRFIQHTRLAAILWMNITLHEITFRTIQRQKD